MTSPCVKSRQTKSSDAVQIDLLIRTIMTSIVSIVSFIVDYRNIHIYSMPFVKHYGGII